MMLYALPVGPQDLQYVPEVLYTLTARGPNARLELGGTGALKGAPLLYRLVPLEPLLITLNTCLASPEEGNVFSTERAFSANSKGKTLG